MSDTLWWDMTVASNDVKRAEAELMVLREKLEWLTKVAEVKDAVEEKDSIAAEIVAILDLVHVHFGGLNSAPISPESREEFRQRILKLKGRAEG